MVNQRVLRHRKSTRVLDHDISFGEIVAPQQSLTAAAAILSPSVRRPYDSEEWQDELWNFYRHLGEFNFGITWFSEGMSRIRLTAAKLLPGGDEPQILETGPAVEAVSRLGHGIAGQAQMMRNLAVQLSVPGDCYLVGRENPFSADGLSWHVYSLEEIRQTNVRKNMTWQVRVDEAIWEDLGGNALVIRVWQPDPQFGWRAMSNARAALDSMHRLDLLNRRVTATILSRLASNGFLVYPDEVTFPVRDEFKDAPDPFIAEIIDIASKVVENPGSPASAIPLPLRVPAEYIEKFQHLTFANDLDEKITEYRIYETRRLATSMRLPGEVVLGRGDVNHWGMWQLEEESIKLYFSTTAETICDALTKGFLHPTLHAMGEDVEDEDGQIIVWYDTSELTVRPDKSSDAIKLYTMGEMSPTAVRRETGFSEADAPDKDDLEEMIMKRVIFGGGTAAGYSNLVINAASQLADVELKSLDTVADPADLTEESGESNPNVGVPVSEQNAPGGTPTPNPKPTGRVTPPPPPG